MYKLKTIQLAKWLNYLHFLLQLKVGVVFDCLRSLDLSWSIEMRLNTVVRRDKKRSSKHVAAPWTVSTRKLERRSMPLHLSKQDTSPQCWVNVGHRLRR